MKTSRGARLTGPEKTVFSGEYWTGNKAVEFGLADAVGDLRSTLRARFGDDVLTPLISAPRGWFGRTQPGLGGFDGLVAASGFRRAGGLGAGGASDLGAFRTLSAP